MSNIEIYQKEIEKELAAPEVMKALLESTFKGFSQENMKKAVLECMIRGFTLKEVLQKDVYAIPYGQGYSLITSIDYIRKIAARSGLSGKSAPKYEVKDGNIISCTVTVTKKDAGDFTETVYFNEYTTGKNLWASKPRKMIAKVAEMGALRSAFPEETAKQYIEEEMERGSFVRIPKEEKTDEEYELILRRAETIPQLQEAWAKLPKEPKEIKQNLEALKNELKAKLETKPATDEDA